MDSGLSASIGGITRAFENHKLRAERISQAAPDGDQFVRDMVELPLDATSVKENTQVVKTQDEMLGALLDLFA